jgi:hypothetical protein
VIHLESTNEGTVSRVTLPWVNKRSLVATVLVASSLTLSTAPIAVAGRSLPTTQKTTTYGVDVFVDNSKRLPDGIVVANGASLFKYVAHLGANAVSLNFPFYMDGLTGSQVYPAAATPSPTLLRTLIEVAESDHLQVQLRPLVLIKGGSLAKWRGVIHPKNVSGWFASYWSCLKPYAIVAAETGVTSISVGAELNSLVEDAPASGSSRVFGWNNDLPNWEGLIQQLQSLVGNRLLYSASHLSVSTIPGIGFGYDFYAPIQFAKRDVPTAATPTAKVVSEFETGMEHAIHRSGFPALTSLSLEEVGVGAYVGAWLEPWLIGGPSGAHVARWVQEDWDKAMCDVAVTNHVAAIYFWALYFPWFSLGQAKANNASIAGFVGTPTASVISACFAREGGK